MSNLKLSFLLFCWEDGIKMIMMNFDDNNVKNDVIKNVRRYSN
jgi:hypothetical protein